MLLLLPVCIIHLERLTSAEPSDTCQFFSPRPKVAAIWCVSSAENERILVINDYLYAYSLVLLYIIDTALMIQYFEAVTTFNYRAI